MQSFGAEVFGFLSSQSALLTGLVFILICTVMKTSTYWSHLFPQWEVSKSLSALIKLRFRKPVITFMTGILLLTTSSAQNAIVTENLLPGNPISEWGVNSSNDFRNPNLNGYTTDISVNKGNTVHFKIDAQNGSTVSAKIYRLGYYGGLGARLQADLGSFPGVKQPAGISDPVTGLLDCSNWSETTSWAVPAGAVSGYYIVKLSDNNGNINNIVFIVRDDASHSDILLQAPDATWQAYNGYGGNNLYNGSTSFPQGHAVKVSYNRPFFVYNVNFQTDGRGSDWYMNDSYPLIRFMERNGYDVTYTSNTDVARAGATLLNHRIFMTGGHDEYWSKEIRDNVEAARAAGVNMVFFTGNESYWKTRWENDVNGNPNRVLVCYKEGTLQDGSQGEATCGGKCDPDPTVWTGLWRMGSAYDAPLPENALSGQISWDEVNPTPAIEVPDTYKNLRFWRNTSVATLASGAKATLAPASLGYEYDWEQYTNSYPHGRIKMSSTTFNPGKTHQLSLYRYNGTGGPLVFGAGTVQWAWGLDATHFGGTGNAVSKDMQQATINLLADMNAQPGTLQSDLVAATASTDFTAPTSTVASPANGATLTYSPGITISGTAADAAGAVGGVEISTDNGATWQVASGTNNWTYTWNPPGTGSFTIKTRSFDDSGNMQDASAGSGPNVIHVNILAAPCPCNIFTTQTPANPLSNDGQAIEVGVKFQSSISGFITGIRFYKTAGNTGTHIGELFAMDGTRLASATFSGESSSGWQTVNFSAPVAITANTTYVAAYFSSAGNYTGTANYFTAPVINTPLTGLQDGTDGPNGVFIYSPTPAFPTSSAGNQPNYWVDVVFNDVAGPIAVAGNTQTIMLPVNTTTLDGSGSSGSITSYAWTQVSGPNTAGITTPAAVSTGITGLIAGTYVFQLSVNGGVSTSNVQVDVLPAGSGVHIFTTQIPTEPVSNDGQSIEVGVKFRSAQAGFITQIRFYKTNGNTGTHIGELYDVTGTKLASATFTGESASGWQTVNFSTPVAITANTTYVASYFSSEGNYTGTANYFTGPIVNDPLTGLANGTDGPNGVYVYTPAPAFPINSPGNAPNYWVDVSFSTTAGAVAIAGADQTITLPTNTATLDGSGSTGTITDYAWTQVSGPNSAGITTPAAVSTTVTGLIPGTYIFQLAINGGSSISTVSVNVLPAGSALHIFTTQIPADPLSNDGQPIELGVKFRSSQAGFITGIRFYKTAGNTGTHIGELYDATGTKLATATFAGESASGWQTVNFSTQVAITANTTYVAAYFSSGGFYTGTANYFVSPVVNGPLTGLQDGTDGPNGVYLYTPSPAFPVNSPGNSPNYWVDVNFVTAATAVAVAGPDQTVVLPDNIATLDGSSSTGTIENYSWTQISGPNTAGITSPGAVSTTVTGLIEGTYVFQLSVNSGVSVSSVTVSVLPPNSAIHIFTTQTPVSPLQNDGQPIELGVKFQSSVDGFIQGIRFYKTAGDAGTHVGQLYDITGVLLASAPFVNETASGWQNVLFTTPIAISANTTYVGAYYSSSGDYNGTANYFTVPVVNSPLTGLANGTDGPNGVYNYTSTGPVFPSSSPGNASNYWVDVDFTLNSTPLPVIYLYWRASKQDDNAKLEWATTMEQNNKGFDVQRSMDGDSWNTLTFVPGAGNSQTPQYYSYLDQHLQPGIYYYRLVQQDLDGHTSISKVLEVDMNGGQVLELKQNRPNPVNGNTTIDMVIPKSGDVLLILYDEMGKPVRTLMNEFKMPGYYHVDVNRNGLSSGIYYYKMYALGQTLVRKMIILY